MRIKKIELFGFKSFADRTEFHLSEGLTCIVGPNGCGKSNVSDALRWVFGERSAKLLRGARMEDVIFNGTDLRKPLGMAEVSLCLDNEDHSLPIAYEEVVLTRRLYRSGQSEYLINRTTCRLRDILDLILDTGMGSNSYSMIEQGRVDHIIQADPEERRFLIEEAAGISKYKVKKEEALRKLERTEQNLLRIRDIIGEIQRNIQYAERQAKRAERYKEQFEQLRKKEVQKALYDLSRIETQRAVEATKKEALAQDLEKLDTGLRELLRKQQEEERLLEEIKTAEAGEAGRSFEIKAEMRAVSQKREFHRERLQALRQRGVEIQKEVEILRLELEELEVEARGRSLEREKCHVERTKTEEAFREEKSRFEKTEEELRTQKERFQHLKEASFQTASDLAQLQSEINRLETRLEVGRHEEVKRKESLTKLLAERQMIEARVSSRRTDSEGIAQHLAATEEKRSRLSDYLASIRSEIDALNRIMGEKRNKFQEMVSRLQLLEELEESNEESERRLLASLSPEKLRGRLVRSLRQVLQVKPGYESAVEAVLGAFAQGLVAEDVETAKDLMQEMAKTHMGPCGIFVQSLVRPNGKSPRKATPLHPKVHHSICEVVQIQKGLEGLFDPLFEDVFVVEEFSHESLEELLALAQEVQLVTKQGILLGPEARIFFRNGRFTPDQGPFRRPSEIRSLKSQSESIAREIDSVKSRKVDLEEKESRLLRDRESLEEEKRQALVQRETAESSLQSERERLEKVEEEIRLLQLETEEFENEMAQTGARLQKLREEVLCLEESERNFSQEQSQLAELLEQTRKRRDGQIQILSRLKTLLENQEEKLRSVEASETLIQTQSQKEKDRLHRLEEEEKELRRQVGEILKEEEAMAAEEVKQEEERIRVDIRLSEIRGQKAFREESLKQITAQAAQHKEEIQSLRSQLHEKELKLMDFSYRETNLLNRIQEAYRINLKEIPQEEHSLKDLEIEKLEEEIRLLKEKLESFGPVNLLAVEEYRELKERYDFLANQEKDLREARESLLEAIRRINRTTKTLFTETFAKAQAFFQEYYQTLFGGGRAELILLEEQEAESEPGIDIMVRPPGKKPQHISLLSGGEKSLTAIALLFALFRIKPSPLCVLDEVDAALDEANVERFLKVLQTFTQSTQFLIITHNRKTITAASNLYGVTMEESGVSKIVSVKVVAPAGSPKGPEEEVLAV